MPNLTTQKLMSLDDNEFADVIDQAVRGLVDDDTAKLLKATPVIDRTYIALVAMKKSVEGQLGAKRADFASQNAKPRSEWAAQKSLSQYRVWRAGALRFKSGVDQWLMTVRAERVRLNPASEAVSSYLKDERTKYLLEYETLRKVVIEHRDHVCGPECDDQCVADVKLWRTVNAS